jgi:uncharacterized membrane protein
MKYVPFLWILFLCFFLLKSYFDMEFDYLIKFCAITSLLYNTSHMISSHLYFYNEVLNDMNIFFF